MRNILKISQAGNLPPHPSKKIAVLTCMDARISINEVLGLKVGEAHIIRNAGGIVTDDALRSLIVSHELLGTERIIIINHTECGMATFLKMKIYKREFQKSTIQTLQILNFIRLVI